MLTTICDANHYFSIRTSCTSVMMPIHIFPLRRKPTRWWHIPSHHSKYTLCARGSNSMGQTNHYRSAPSSVLRFIHALYVYMIHHLQGGLFLSVKISSLPRAFRIFRRGAVKKHHVVCAYRFIECLSYNILVSVSCAVQTINTLWKTKSHLQGCPYVR